MKTRFVILAGPRSGSTAFRMWINSHPNIRCHDEVLLKSLEAPDAISAFYQKNGYKFDYDSQSLTFPNSAIYSQFLTDFFNSLFSGSGHPAPWDNLSGINEYRKITGYENEQAVGFKFMYYLLETPQLGHWLSHSGVRIIHLLRENLLKQYLSYLAYTQREIAHSESRIDAIRLRLDTDSLVQTLSALDSRIKQIRQRFSGKNCLEVSYESFCDEPEALTSIICRFLDVDSAQMSPPPLKKLNTDHLPDLIDNYSEVVECISGTPFRNML